MVPRRGLDPKIKSILYAGFKGITNKNYPCAIPEPPKLSLDYP